MKLYEWDTDGMWEVDGSARAPAGNDYIMYEEAHQIEVDRDIKAANLQLLVEKVLAVEDAVQRAVDSAGDGGDVYEAEYAHSELINLARSLKQ